MSNERFGLIAAAASFGVAAAIAIALAVVGLLSDSPQHITF